MSAERKIAIIPKKIPEIQAIKYRMVGLTMFHDDNPDTHNASRYLQTKAARSEWTIPEGDISSFLDEISAMTETVIDYGRPLAQSALYKAFRHHQAFSFEDAQNSFIVERPLLTLTTNNSPSGSDDCTSRFFMKYEDSSQDVTCMFALKHNGTYSLDLEFANPVTDTKLFTYTSGSDYQPLTELTKEEQAITLYYINQSRQILKREPM